MPHICSDNTEEFEAFKIQRGCTKRHLQLLNSSPQSQIKSKHKIKHTKSEAYLICKPYPRLSQSQSEDTKQ